MSLPIKTGKIIRAQRVVLYGIAGVGKSTFASKFPKPLFADTEGGTDQLDVDRVVCQKWPDLLEVVRAMPSLDYQTLIIDSVDWACDHMTTWMLADDDKQSVEDYGYGKGYSRQGELWTDFLRQLNALQAAGIHVVLIGHAEVRKHEMPDDQGSYDRYLLKLPKRAQPITMEWADAVFFANYETKIVERDGKKKAVGGKRRLLHTDRCAAYDGKNRLGLKPTLAFEFEEVAEHFPPLRRVAALAQATTSAEVPEEKDDNTPAKGGVKEAFKGAVAGGNEKEIQRFLIHRNELSATESLDDLTCEEYMNKVISNPDAFLNAVSAFIDAEDAIPM